jgi:carbonic anhydrase
MNLESTGISEIADAKKLFLKYPKLTGSFSLYNNGRSIAITLPESYKAGFGWSGALKDLDSKMGNAYRLWQVNFHAPSEHTINGVRMPLEMQMMHQRVTGGGAQTAVVVVLFQEEPNKYLKFFDSLLEGLPETTWSENTIVSGIDFSDVLGGSPFYQYTGSLTVPPCESDVVYYVRQEPIGVAPDYLHKFHDVLVDTCVPNGNFRLIQPHLPNTVLNVVPSVDVVNAPDQVVRPLPPLQAAGEQGLANEVGKGSAYTNVGGVAVPVDCPPEDLDRMWANFHRVQVGDSEEIARIKEEYNRNLREMQLAENQYGQASLRLELSKKLYDNSPGPVDKIQRKWDVVAAEAALRGVKEKLANVHDLEEENIRLAEKAVAMDCGRPREAWRHKPALSARPASSAPPESSAPPAERPAAPEESKSAKYAYPEPQIKLPRGLHASPFADGSEGPTEASKGDKDVIPDKIAANLHQADIPPGDVTQPDKPLREAGVPKMKYDDVVLELDLPISNFTDGKDAFTKDLVEALAKTAHIQPSRLKVKEIKAKDIAKVHSTESAWRKWNAAQRGNGTVNATVSEGRVNVTANATVNGSSKPIFAPTLNGTKLVSVGFLRPSAAQQ